MAKRRSGRALQFQVGGLRARRLLAGLPKAKGIGKALLQGAGLFESSSLSASKGCQSGNRSNHRVVFANGFIGYMQFSCRSRLNLGFDISEVSRPPGGLLSKSNTGRGVYSPPLTATREAE